MHFHYLSDYVAKLHRDSKKDRKSYSLLLKINGKGQNH